MKKTTFLSLVAICGYLGAAAFSSSGYAEVRGYSCLGTEPFFHITIKGQTVTIDSPHLIVVPKKFSVEGPQVPMGLQPGTVSVYTSKEPSAFISINGLGGECTDGMSDNTYSHHLIYSGPGGVLYGCCEPLAQHDD